MAHRYRLYPDPDQLPTLDMHCDHARAVWNLAVEQDQFALRYRPYRIGKRANWPGRSFDLADARAESDWLRAGSSSVQQQALRDYQRAMANHHGNRSHFHRPTWRSKHRGNQGFTIRDVRTAKLSRRWATVNVPKVGPVRFRLSRPLPEHGMAKVTLDRAGRWHVAFVAPQAPVERSNTGATVGVDLGVAHSVTLSDGRHLDCPRSGPGEAERRLRLERKLARQRKGSNRRARTKASLARLRARDADRRRDWVEKVSTALVIDHDVIVFEDVSARQLTGSAKGTIEAPGRNVRAKAGLNRSILAAGWAVRQRTEEKAAASAGCRTLRVPARNTSRRCAACGHVAAESRESQSRFCCVACGHEANADANASVNILAAGLAVAGRGDPPVRVVREASTTRRAVAA